MDEYAKNDSQKYMEPRQGEQALLVALNDVDLGESNRARYKVFSVYNCRGECKQCARN
jgi:hypothetical protein